MVFNRTFTAQLVDFARALQAALESNRVPIQWSCMAMFICPARSPHLIIVCLKMPEQIKKAHNQEYANCFNPSSISRCVFRTWGLIKAPVKCWLMRSCVSSRWPNHLLAVWMIAMACWALANAAFMFFCFYSFQGLVLSHCAVPQSSVVHFRELTIRVTFIIWRSRQRSHKPKRLLLFNATLAVLVLIHSNPI